MALQGESLGGGGSSSNTSGYSGGGGLGRDFLDISNTVLGDGTISYFNISLGANQPGGAYCKLKVFRPDGSDYKFVGESQQFSGLIQGDNTELELDTPITVESGDIIGVFLSTGSSHKVSNITKPGFNIHYKEGDFTSDQPISSYLVITDGSPAIEVFGSYVGSGSTINITSVSDYECITQDDNGEAVFNIGGEVTGNTISKILYSHDNETFSVLKNTPTLGAYNVPVTIAGQKDIYLKSADDSKVTAVRYKLTASYSVACGLQQSNGVSRIINAQPINIDEGNPVPIMYKNGVFSPLADPTGIDLRGGMDGSLWPYIAQKYSELGVAVCIANLAQGGTTAAEWVKGEEYYDRIEQFATDVGGISALISLIGESDSVSGTGTVQFKADYMSVANDINTDFGCDIYAVYFPVAGSTGTTANVNEIRSAYDEIISENGFIHFGGDLSVIDISSAANPLNDNLHIKIDSDATEASQIIWDALTYVESTLTITDSNTPDGTYSGKVYNDDDDTFIGSFDFVFSGGDCDLTLSVDASTNIHYIIPGDNPPVTGIANIGVTV